MSEELNQCDLYSQLEAGLREVRYLKMIGKLEIPDEAQELFDRSETLWQFTHNLGLIINWLVNSASYQYILIKVKKYIVIIFYFPPSLQYSKSVYLIQQKELYKSKL